MVQIQLYGARIATFISKHYFKSTFNPRALCSNVRLREGSNFLFIALLSIMCFHLLVLVTVTNLETLNNFKTKTLKLSGVV